MKDRAFKGVFPVILTVFAACVYVNSQDTPSGCKNAETVASQCRHATAESGGAGNVARLESPWLCATGTSVVSLRFGYYMGRDSSKCRLSVLIIFEAEKLVGGRCGLFTAGIYIDDIVFGVQNTFPSSFYTCPTPPTTEQPATSSTPLPSVLTTGDSSISTEWISNNTFTTTEEKTSTSHPDVSVPFSSTIKDGEQNRQTGDENDGLGGGAVAGIVVALVVVAAVIALVVFFLLRRKRGEKSSSTSDRNDPSRAVSNLAYSPTDDPDTGVFNRNGSGPTETYYNTRAVPNVSDNTRANPRQDADAYEAVATRQTGGAYQTADGVRPNKSGNTVNGGSDGGKGKGDDQDEYNKLSFEPTRVVGPSGANHLYDSTGVTDTYNVLSHGNQETAVPKSTAADYDHVQK
ncbi:hypothetical protein BaRGS_00018647 [Batillaria attramentaria]|uniref:Uncharacterized protein n=1 Tax=Batillaria attramentaria TaxID=370345 RepID=A0ABD0KS42_9CAEN